MRTTPKFKTPCYKQYHQKSKKTLFKLKKIFANYLSEKGFLSRIYKAH